MGYNFKTATFLFFGVHRDTAPKEKEVDGEIKHLHAKRKAAILKAARLCNG